MAAQVIAELNRVEELFGRERALALAVELELGETEASRALGAGSDFAKRFNEATVVSERSHQGVQELVKAFGQLTTLASDFFVEVLGGGGGRRELRQGDTGHEDNHLADRAHLWERSEAGYNASQAFPYDTQASGRHRRRRSETVFRRLRNFITGPGQVFRRHEDAQRNGGQSLTGGATRLTRVRRPWSVSVSP